MKNLARAFVGALFTYIVAPILVGLFTNGVNDKSLAGRLLNAIYPPQISERITQPGPAPFLLPTPTPTPSDVAGAPAASGAIAASLPTVLTRTPRDAPVAASIAGPLSVNGADFRLSLFLTSSTDDLPIFATGGYNLDGWSATVQPGNISCSININGLTGLTSSQIDRWTQDEVRMTRLPAGSPVTVAAGFHCDREIAAARSVSFTATLGYAATEQARTVRFFANDVPLRGGGER